MHFLFSTFFLKFLLILIQIILFSQHKSFYLVQSLCEDNPEKQTANEMIMSKTDTKLFPLFALLLF